MEPEVRTRQQFWGNFEPKEAEAGGTHVMPHGSPPGRKAEKAGVIPKTGSFLPVETEGVDEEGIPGEQPPANPQAAPISPRVNVTGKEAPKPAVEKKASRYALPHLQMYPLDSYADVEKAASYFDEWKGHFSPGHRREYCSNLTKRASALGIKVSPEISKYGSATYAPAAEVEIALDGRKGLLDDQEVAVLEKLSEARPTMEPELFAETLSQFDQLTGLDHHYGSDVLDPFYSTFGVKVAEDDDGISHVIGNDIITNKQLKEYAKGPLEAMEHTFGDDLMEEFRKDPVGIFNSLPLDQKKIIIRMASEPSPV